MGLRKGMTNNRNGRRKGAINRLNKDLRQSISEFLNNNFDSVIHEWERLTGKEKVNFYRDLLQYEIPKKQAVATHEPVVENPFINLSNEELILRIEKILNNGFPNNPDKIHKLY